MQSDTIKSMVDNPHWINLKNKAYWNFLLMSYEGGVDYTNAAVIGSANNNNQGILDQFRYFVNGEQQVGKTIYGNLFQHPKEKTEDYNRRVFSSYYYNFCAPIIDIYSDHLFKQPIIEDYGAIKASVDAIKEDVDKQGSSIEEFRRQIGDMAQLYGHCFVVVDSPVNSEIESVRTRLDQMENRAFPYFCLYPPQAVKNWSLDEFGKPYWVLVQEQADSNENPDEYDPKNVAECKYRLWTRTEWRLYDDEYNLEASGTHEVGEVPIVCVFSKKSNKARSFLGISELADISFIARDIYNASSELRQILRDQTFAFLALQGTSDEYSDVVLGTGKGLLYPEGRNAPQYVSPSTDNALTYFDHIDRQVSKIYQMAKLEGGSVGTKAKLTTNTATVDTQSGASKAWDFNQTNSSLSSKANNLEDAEIKMWSLFAKWEGKEFDGNIEYPDEFSVTDISSDLDEAEQESRVGLGKTFDSEVRKAIVRKKFPSMPEDELAVIDSEIDALMNKQTVGSAMADRVKALIAGNGVVNKTNPNYTGTAGTKTGASNGNQIS